MKKKLNPSFFLAVLFIICLSCASKPLPDQGVTIVSPKANDVLKAGDSYEILWKAEPAESEFGAMVTVEFLKGGGNVLGDGSRKCPQQWKVLIESS